MRRIIIGLVIIIILVGGGYWAYQQFLAPQPEDENTTAVVNTISVNTSVEVVSAEGQIVPRRHANLSFQMGGQVTELLVAEGDVVSAGDPLLRLDATDLQNNVEQTELGLAQAEASLAAAQKQLELAQASVEAAQVGVTAAEAQLALITADPSEQQVALTAVQVEAAEAAINQASANLGLTNEGPTDSQLISAEAQITAAIAQRRPIRDAYGQILQFEITGDPEEQARIQLTAAEANVIAAQAALEALNEGATPAQRAAASAAVAQAQAQRQVAEAQLDLLLADPKPEQVRVAELGVAQAETAVTQAQVSVTQAQATVAQAQAGVTQAQARLTAAQNALNRATLIAPFNGTIAALNTEVGEIVGMSQPVVTLADLSGWQVETTDLTELDIVNIEVGLPVEISVDALPDEVLRGTVSDIATVSSITRGDITYKVTIDLDEAAEFPLRWGMTVFVDVDVE
ncbi:MAG: efflux RND transporter periplasmic adaptor subunit [Ardenticatenaceae bacterium]|nr:efflux RND transporter periplasmic adaptor subunit [Ardenticatenaceae bacterium]